MERRPRIALLIDTATTWGMGLIEGIVDYAHSHTDWQILLGPRGKYDRMMLPDRWDGQGVIARITNRELADQVIRTGIPAVDVSWYRFGEARIPRCTCDESEVAELAIKYFHDLGFRQFAYCGSSIRPNYTDRLGEAFVEKLKRRNYRCHRFSPSCGPAEIMPPVEELDRMVEWLRGLPKPVALLAFDSLQARQVTEACEAANTSVPHEVAVLGGEYDHLSCTISKPQLSSIDHSPRRVGYMAAELLDGLIQGAAPPDAPVFVPVSRILASQSTDTVAIDDDLLAAAVRFIKAHCHEPIHVGDILAAVPLSRRALEKGFRSRLGRSPAEEIRRLRIERVVQLLCDTSWPMPRVASASGFDGPEVMTRVFRRELGTTPSEFRKQHLLGRKSLTIANAPISAEPSTIEHRSSPASI